MVIHHWKPRNPMKRQIIFITNQPGMSIAAFVKKIIKLYLLVLEEHYSHLLPNK
jgi:hypothetical protein